MAEHENSGRRDVVRLEDARAERRHQNVDRIERYWHEVRGNRLVPSRTDIDPRGLTGVLANAFVLERIATGLARFRIAGSHMTDLMGLDVKGMPLSTVFLPEARQNLADALEAVFDEPSVVRLRLGTESGFGRPAMEGEMVLLPLRSDLGEISRVLGGVSMHGDIGRAPRRLRIEAQVRDGLTGVGGPDAVPSKIFEDTQPRREAPATRAKPDTPLQRGHLTLVVDNTE